MTTSVITPSLDGWISSRDSVYATADTGGSTMSTVSTSSAGLSGSQAFAFGDYFLYQSFLAFDTSSIPLDDIIVSAVLRLYGHQDLVDTTYRDVQLRTFDFGASITTADWRNSTQLAALTLLSTQTTVGWNIGGWNTMPSTTNFIQAINKSGTTKMVFHGAAQGITPPVDNENISNQFSEGANPPELIITHYLPGMFGNNF